MTLTDTEIIVLRELAEAASLEGRDLLLRPLATVSRVCNGIGPSWFPTRLRLAIDSLHPSLKVVAAIHDLWYYYGADTTEDFLRANRAFRENGEKVAKYLYGWYNPRRYLVAWNAARFAKLCDLAGKIAYVSAIDERRSDENTGAPAK
jgi:hypothetical protein